MKRISEMDETELLALTDEQIDKLIDYECALEGVPMLPAHPGPEPNRVDLKPDATAYEIAGIFTLNADHAAKILEAINLGQIYKESYPGGDYNTKYLTPLLQGDYSMPKIESKIRHSAEQWDKIKGPYKEYTARKSVWEKLNKEYQGAITSRASINKNCWEFVLEARDHASQREVFRQEFKIYLDLAEGNPQIAFGFLTKVKDLSDFPELKEEFCPSIIQE